MQIADEEVQDRRSGGGRPRRLERSLRPPMDQRQTPGAGQVRHRVVTHPTSLSMNACDTRHNFIIVTCVARSFMNDGHMLTRLAVAVGSHKHYHLSTYFTCHFSLG